MDDDKKTAPLTGKAKAFFKKGDPRINIKGRPPTAAAVQKLKRITSETVAQQIQDVAFMSVAELEIYLARRDVPAMGAMFGRILLEALKTGDPSKASFLMERTVGKVKERLEVSTPVPFIAEYSDGTKEIMGAVVGPPVLDGEVAQEGDDDADSGRGGI